jgi:hypothetical protein
MCVERAMKCGFVFAHGAMLVMPEQLAGWHHRTLTKEEFSQVCEIFPSALLDRFMAHRAHQIRVYTVDQNTDQNIDQNTDQRDADHDEAIPPDEEALEDTFFENMADGLSDAGPPEMEYLDVTLDGTIEVIQEVLATPPKHMTARAHAPDPNDRMTRLQSSLTILRRELREWKTRWGTLQGSTRAPAAGGTTKIGPSRFSRHKTTPTMDRCKLLYDGSM